MALGGLAAFLVLLVLGNLVGFVLDLFLLAAQAPGLPQVQTREVRRRLDHADAGNVAVGEAGKAIDPTETPAAGQFRVEYQFATVAAAFPKPSIDATLSTKMDMVTC